MAKETDNYAKGVDAREPCRQSAGHAVMARFKELSPAFENEALAVVFGRTWRRSTPRRALFAASASSRAHRPALLRGARKFVAVHRAACLPGDPPRVVRGTPQVDGAQLLTDACSSHAADLPAARHGDGYRIRNRLSDHRLVMLAAEHCCGRVALQREERVASP
jgi:hypothetical protein